jgi:hypothetical protein
VERSECSREGAGGVYTVGVGAACEWEREKLEGEVRVVDERGRG